MKRKIQFICYALTLFMLLTAVSACGNNQPSVASETTGVTAGETTVGAADETDGGTTASDLPWLEYSIDLCYSTPATTLDLSTDVVTPYVEDLFKIRVNEITQNANQQIPFRERLSAMIAAGNAPDVIAGGIETIAFAYSTGRYGEGVEELIDGMTNLNKYMDPKFWPRFMIDGKKVQIPEVTVHTGEEPHLSDPWNIPRGSWTLWTREDLLTACGYEFTPVADIVAKHEAAGTVPSPDEFAISPPIDSPDAFMNYLLQIRDLEMMVNNVPLIPLSGVGWNQFHIGNMFDFGHWRIRDGEVDGFLGSPGTYDYYKWLNQAYQEGLLDPDFLANLDDQVQNKVAQGLVGVGMFVPDLLGAIQALQAQDIQLRFIPWPKSDENWGAFDIFEGGFWRFIIHNDFEDKERLIDYWDWFFSDEGLDLITWGPESSGLWEIDSSGKKVFKDEAVKEAMLTNDSGPNGPFHYGMYAQLNPYFTWLSRAAITAPNLNNFNPFSYQRSYPPQLDIVSLQRSFFGPAGNDFTGNYSYGDGTDEVGLVNGWFWSMWADEKAAPVLMARSDAEFDAAFEAAIREFKEDTNYEEAQARMAVWFAENQ
ncbi:MAG: hypothetical protein FWH01_06260 [Oscillospiraceae bacterium]|nr:hypothetical protein [Oscillospiraceae bacterium]